MKCSRLLSVCALGLVTSISVTRATVMSMRDFMSKNQTFESAGTPVFVKFWMPGCPPCRQMEPIFHAVAAQFPHITFVDCNIREHEEFINRYNILSVPAFLIFHNGRCIGRLTGIVDEAVLKNMAHNILPSPR